MTNTDLHDFDVPLLDISVPAGFPSPALDYMEQRINLNNFLIQRPQSTFIVRCSGMSMVGAFIPPKCYLVVDRSPQPQNGDIVLAYRNGEFTVKFLRRNDHRAWLVPANKNFKEIEITGDDHVIIWGVVITVISNPKDIRHVCFS